MMNNNHYSYKSQEELIQNLSDKIVANLKEAIDGTGKASFLVSGGSTPKPLFEKLSSVDMEWESVVIGLCDERWVSQTHSDSNERFVKEFLLKSFAKKANFISMYQKDIKIEDAQEFCSNIYQKELFPFDVVILGMGTDGHTASLFPHNVKLSEAFDENNESLCIFMKPDIAPHERMSLTKEAILSAQNIYLHFEGKEKKTVYDKVIAGIDKYEMPISSVINQMRKKIEVYYR